MIGDKKHDRRFMIIVGVILLVATYPMGSYLASINDFNLFTGIGISFGILAVAYILMWGVLMHGGQEYERKSREHEELEKQ